LYGKEFYDDARNTRCRARLLAGVNLLQSQGRIANPEHGHWLKGKTYGCLFEFKTFGFRFYAFQVQRVYLITNGAKKESSEGRQNRHRNVALTLRCEFYDAENQ